MNSWEAGFMPEAQGMQPAIGQVGVPQLNQSAMPPEYQPQASSTPAGGHTSRQMLKVQRFDGSASLDTFLLKFQNMARYLQWNE